MRDATVTGLRRLRDIGSRPLKELSRKRARSSARRASVRPSSRPPGPGVPAPLLKHPAGLSPRPASQASLARAADTLQHACPTRPAALRPTLALPLPSRLRERLSTTPRLNKPTPHPCPFMRPRVRLLVCPLRRSRSARRPCERASTSSPSSRPGRLSCCRRGAARASCRVTQCQSPRRLLTLSRTQLRQLPGPQAQVHLGRGAHSARLL